MRFGTGAHLVNALSFAVAQLLIAGVNLSLLATIVNRLLGWPMWVGLVLAAAFVLFYITVGGLSAAIYNEVLQFFVIVAALLPLTLIGLHRVGGWSGMKERIAGDGMLGDEQLHSWPGQALSGFDSPVLSVVGIVFGLGFVLSFGYWTTNFVEVQRAMASKSITAARMTPIIGAFPKMFIPFIVIVPGMIAGVLVGALQDGGDAEPNDAILYLMRDLLPNGLLGVAIAGLLASFMAGMAANISAFNTVFSYDLWQAYVVKDRKDGYYLKVGRWATVAATVIAVGTALIANNFGNVMDYLQTLFGFFNAPLFATFLLGMFWKRMTPHAGWSGLVAGTAAAIIFWAFSLGESPLVDLPGQGTAFVAAGLAFVVDILVSVVVTSFTRPKPDEELVGFVKSVTPKAMLEDPKEKELPWYRRTVPLGMLCLGLVIILNLVFH
jgi:SSS family solute:Na+ symporter